MKYKTSLVARTSVFQGVKFPGMKDCYFSTAGNWYVATKFSHGSGWGETWTSVEQIGRTTMTAEQWKAILARLPNPR
ncbi:hypothetical protein [Nocardioides ultimimeridianus]